MSEAPVIIHPERVVEGISHTGIAGYFEVELIHKPTGLVKQKLRFKNLITNAGLNLVGSGMTLGLDFMNNGWMAVGTGTTPPTVTDIALQVQTGSRTSSRGTPTIAMTTGAENAYEYFWKKCTKVFFPGVATGNLTEVGIFNASSGGTMWCRQLFRDSGGNPITITKTDDDELRITYEFRLYTMLNTSVTTTTIKSVSTTCTTRAYDVDADIRWARLASPEDSSGLISALGTWGISTGTAYSGLFASSSMPALTDVQTGGITGPTSATLGSYVAGTYYRDNTYIWAPSAGNLTVGSIIWGGQAPFYQYLAPFITTFAPVFTKTDTERLTFVARTSWGRV